MLATAAAAGGGRITSSREPHEPSKATVEAAIVATTPFKVLLNSGDCPKSCSPRQLCRSASTAKARISPCQRKKVGNVCCTLCPSKRCLLRARLQSESLAHSDRSSESVDIIFYRCMSYRFLSPGFHRMRFGCRHHLRVLRPFLVLVA
jgi:hypothetical protein